MALRAKALNTIPELSLNRFKDPARLSLLASLLLMLLAIAMAWSGFRGNAAVRNLEMQQIETAIQAAFTGKALKIPADIEIASTDLPFAHPGAVASVAIFYDFGNRTASFLTPQAALPAQNMNANDLIAKIEPLLHKTAAISSLRLRGSLPTSAGMNRGLTIHQDSVTSGFLIQDKQVLAFVAVPASKTRHNGEVTNGILLAISPANGSIAPEAAQLARTGHLEFHAQPISRSDENRMEWRSAGDRVYVTWKSSASGSGQAALIQALLVTFAASAFGWASYAMTRKLAASEARASRLAAEDLLTGLPNRMLFTHYVNDELERYQRHGRGLALLYLDFDRFKEVNDTFGHDGGDQLLIAASKRIESVLRRGDKLGRFGGDEFGVLQLDVNDISASQNLSQRILTVMNEPFIIDGQMVQIGVSIGIALAPQNSTDRNELMRLADLALYRAKNNGRNCFVFYDDAMNRELQKRKAIEDELRMAIQNDELEVYYQPVVSASTNRMIGVEALVRWPHEKKGLINPDEFISIAEERGLIHPLGEWVLRRACIDCMNWPGLRLAINISAAQFRHAEFVPSVKKILAETAFDPSRLELELTESVMINDAAQAEEALIALRSMGMRIALDDFGTSYSSLIYLRRFAIDKIKIDKSFLHAMEMSNESEQIIANIIDLGRRLGLTVTAEGVETFEQAHFLKKTGCDELQGFLFGKPRPKLFVAGMIGRELLHHRANSAPEPITVAV